MQGDTVESIQQNYLFCQEKFVLHFFIFPMPYSQTLVLSAFQIRQGTVWLSVWDDFGQGGRYQLSSLRLPLDFSWQRLFCLDDDRDDLVHRHGNFLLLRQPDDRSVQRVDLEPFAYLGVIVHGRKMFYRIRITG